MTKGRISEKNNNKSKIFKKILNVTIKKKVNVLLEHLRSYLFIHSRINTSTCVMAGRIRADPSRVSIIL